MRVLLVEDDRELADYVRRALEEEHHAVTTCFDGSSGLTAIQTATFDILVLVVMLPTLDGFQLTRRARLEVKTFVGSYFAFTALNSSRRGYIRGIMSAARKASLPR